MSFQNWTFQTLNDELQRQRSDLYGDPKDRSPGEDLERRPRSPGASTQQYIYYF